MITAKNHLWQDTYAILGNAPYCKTSKIPASRFHARNKHPSTNPGKPGATIYMDLIPKLSTRGITTTKTFPYFLLLVARYSMRPFLRGNPDKSTEAVLYIFQEFQAPTSYPFTIIDQLPLTYSRQTLTFNLYLESSRTPVNTQI
jgi:hypothetical protein